MGNCREQNTGAFVLESSNRVTGILETRTEQCRGRNSKKQFRQLPTVEKLNLKLGSPTVVIKNVLTQFYSS